MRNQFEFLRLMTLIGVMLSGSIAAHAQSQSLTVDSARPVADAVEKLETIYLVPITYEEILYLHSGETTTNDKGLVVLKHRAVTFTYDLPPKGATLEARKALAVKALSQL